MKDVMYDFAFTLMTDKNLDEVTGQELLNALIARVNRMSPGDMIEACGLVDWSEEIE